LERNIKVLQEYLSYWKVLMDNKVLKELFSTFKLLRGNLLKDVDELWKKNSYDNL
jgi:hypothetical protein